MPVWLISALNMLRGAATTGARVAGSRAALAGGAGLTAGSLLPSGNGDGLFGLFGEEEKKRRKRRRNALSSDDLKTALTISSAISKKAAENFILMRVRRG